MLGLSCPSRLAVSLTTLDVVAAFACCFLLDDAAGPRRSGRFQGFGLIHTLPGKWDECTFKGGHTPTGIGSVLCRQGVSNQGEYCHSGHFNVRILRDATNDSPHLGTCCTCLRSLGRIVAFHETEGRREWGERESALPGRRVLTRRRGGDSKCPSVRNSNFTTTSFRER